MCTHVLQGKRRTVQLWAASASQPLQNDVQKSLFYELIAVHTCGARTRRCRSCSSLAHRHSPFLLNKVVELINRSCPHAFQGKSKTVLQLWAAWHVRHSPLDLGKAALGWLLVACTEVCGCGIKKSPGHSQRCGCGRWWLARRCVCVCGCQ